LLAAVKIAAVLCFSTVSNREQTIM
jgi:hypothetical protein